MPGLPKAKNNVLSVPDKMLTELALGTDTPHAVAARYGYDDIDFDNLEQQPHFQRAMTARVAELESKGEIFRVKARYLADDLLTDVYNDAKDTKDPKTRLEAIKFLSTAGGVANPVVEKTQGIGRQVRIHIDMGAGTGSVTLDFNEMFGEGANDALALDGEYEEIDE